MAFNPMKRHLRSKARKTASVKKTYRKAVKGNLSKLGPRRKTR
jgi:hypothetical protein